MNQFERLLNKLIVVFEQSVKYIIFMARPKRHEREETLEKAVSFFWKNGFSGGSTRELGQALDMHPGSIYAAFGSKEGLCLEALDFYGEKFHQKFVELMDQKDFFEGLRAFLQAVVAERDLPSTCFVAKTLTSRVECEQRLVDRAKEMMSQFQQALIERVAQAQQDGEISRSIDSPAFAALVQAMIMGIRGYADAIPGDADLEPVVEEALTALKLRARPD